jgi:hypothetical protein
MKVGVCAKHQKPLVADMPNMTKKAHDGWLEEVAMGSGNVDWVQNKGLKLNIIGIQS